MTNNGGLNDVLQMIGDYPHGQFPEIESVRWLNKASLNFGYSSTLSGYVRFNPVSFTSKFLRYQNYRHCIPISM